MRFAATVFSLGFFIYFQVRPDVLPPLLSQGGATQAPQVQTVEATNQKPQTLVPLSPSLEQAQPGLLQQPGPQGGPQFVPSLQQFAWSPLGGSLIMMQPGIQESLPANQPALPQQPLVGQEEKTYHNMENKLQQARQTVYLIQT